MVTACRGRCPAGCFFSCKVWRAQSSAREHLGNTELRPRWKGFSAASAESPGLPAGGGLEFISQLLNNQSGAQNANSNAVNAASNNAQLALQALGNAGTLGGTMQSQAQQSAQAQAQAAQQIAEYNSQLGTQTNLANTAATNNANQYNLTNAQNVGNQNTGLANYQTQYNAQIPETLYQNQLGKANALSNVYGQQANLAEQQAAQQSAFTGNLIGAGATMGGSYLAGQAMGNGLKALSAGNNSGIQAGNDQSMYPGYTENANNIAAENGFLTEYKGGEIPKMANGGVMRYQPPQQGPNSVGGSGKINLTDILALLSATGLGGLWLNQKFGPGSNPTDLNKEVGNTLGNAALSQSDPNPNPQMLADGGFCYFNGGKVSHDHAICMKAGGHVPGTPKVGGAVNTFANDTVKGLLAPGEIVLPRSVTQAPNAPVKAAQFVNQVKNPAPASGSFQDVLSHLANHGMEMHIRPSKMTTRI